jgi:AcrR family transcriptional regulator
MPKIVKDADIFLAVINVITERGYAGATTKQMAEAAGVSEVTLFRKYGSKAQMVRQAISVIADQEDFESAVHYTGDVTVDLLRIVQKYQDSAVRFGHFFAALLSEMQRYPELIESISTSVGIMKNIGQLMERYQENGVLRKEHPLHAVTTLLGPLIYTGMIRKAVPDGLLPPLDLQDHVTRYLEGHRSDK